MSLVDPSNGFYGIKAFAAAVIGGFGSLLGTVLGGLIIGVSETLAARYLPPGFKEIVAYLIMLVVLMRAAARAVLHAAAQEGLRAARVRILFKTSYLDDIRLFQHERPGLWYGLLVAGAAGSRRGCCRRSTSASSPRCSSWPIAGVGLMLLIGYTGLVSLGHGAFMAIGAYTNTYLITKGVPFLVALPAAGLAALVAGVLIAVPANRMTGIYLAIATLAFSQIVEQVVIRWESVTRGFQGMPVPPPDLFGHAADARLAVLLPLPRRAGAGGAGCHQPGALAHGPRPRRDPRLARSRRRAWASICSATRRRSSRSAPASPGSPARCWRTACASSRPTPSTS